MHLISHLRSGERGAVLVMVALWMPVLLLVGTFVVDTGNWWVHKRHLQMQADAAALAAARDFNHCPDNSQILARTAEYSGATYNAQVGGTPATDVHRLINSKTFYNQPTQPPPDDTVELPPCSAAMVDVKLTETDLPWMITPLADLVGQVVPFINAHARVQINQLQTASGALPVGVPDVNPKVARAWFINESTGAVLASTSLTKAGTSNGLIVWDNAGAPLPVKFDTGDVDVGVVIALGGATSTTCGQSLVECYDAGAPATSGGLPSRGIVYVRGYSMAGDGLQSADRDPVLRDVTLVPGGCSDPYFSSAGAGCTFTVRARADFGTVGGVDQTTAVGAKLTATVGGTTVGLAYNAAAKLWDSAPLTLAAASGPNGVRVDWEETVGKLHGNTCKTGNGNKCTGSFGTVQRAFSATSGRSGPIEVAQVWEDGVQWANAVERCSSVQTSCTHTMVVRIGVKGNLGNASSVNDPVVALRVIGGSQNQSLDCDPAVSTLKDELAGGCAPAYTRNTGTTCPGSASALWATAQPWPCVAIQTGGATNQVPAGMNQRVLGSDKPSACTAPNRWNQFPNLDPSDPRILQVVLTPFGAFSGSGSTTVPVTDFATFYVTGWTGQGQGFNNPCQGNGDDPVPNNDAGYIVGHFIKYIQTLNTGGGTEPCDLSAFGTCVAVMTR
jgi:hypothetical protein